MKKVLGVLSLTLLSLIVAAQHKKPSNQQTIFANLGVNQTQLYNDTIGLPVAGGSNHEGFPEIAVGFPFTPHQNSTVTTIYIPLGMLSGPRVLDVGLYADSNGTVGSELASVQVTEIPRFGTCCKLVTANIAPTSIIAGTQYWVVASPDPTGPDTAARWAVTINGNAASNDNGTGWFTYTDSVNAVAVVGTIP